MRAPLRTLLAAGLFLAGAQGARAAEEAIEFPKVDWSFKGIFGTFDRASAQRGFQVYKEVCSNCHSLKFAYYRDLRGIGLNEDQIKSIAAEYEVPDIGEDGSPTTRKALPSDHFHSPFANERAARAANNGALPPDQSVIVKAREGGPDYIHALMIGYGDPPEGMKIGDGMYYNKYFHGHQIAMPPPLSDGQVTYADGTQASVDQMAKDVTTFLAFVANPEMEERKRLGVKVVLFLTLLTGLTYAVKRKVWADAH